MGVLSYLPRYLAYVSGACAGPRVQLVKMSASTSCNRGYIGDRYSEVGSDPQPKSPDSDIRVWRLVS